MDHIDSLRLRLSNERIRLAEASNEAERYLRTTWIAQLEREISQERAFTTEADLTDEELLKALASNS